MITKQYIEKHTVHKPWSKMNKVEKRKTVALDALIQIKNKYIIPTIGTYGILNFDEDDNNGKKFQQLLQTSQACEACALGSLMAGNVIRLNKCNNIWNFSEIEERFAKIWTSGELRLIEGAFENYLFDRISFGVDVQNEHEISLLYDQFRHKLYIKESFGVSDQQKTYSRVELILKNIIASPTGHFLNIQIPDNK